MHSDRLLPGRHAHGRRTGSRERPASPAPTSPGGGGDAPAPSEPDHGGDTPKRPVTPAKPDGNDQAGMWPDPWAGHRC